MAYRSSAAVSATTNGNITATPAGVQVDDYLGGNFVGDFTNGFCTPPLGWSERANADLSGPDGQVMRYHDKIATGSDSFTFVAAQSGSSLCCVAWSGRNTSAPRSATPVVTLDTTARATGFTANISGITAVAGDHSTGSDRWTLSQITNYTERQAEHTVDFVNVACDTRDNVSAGATGTLQSTLTRVSGSGTAGWSAVVVAIASAAAPVGNIAWVTA